MLRACAAGRLSGLFCLLPRLSELQMRIALVNSYFYPDEPGGAERSVRILAEALGEAGHQVLVVALSDLGANEVAPPQHHSLGVEVARLRIQNARLPARTGSVSALGKLIWHTKDTYNRAAARAVVRVLAEFHPDVIHTNNLAGFSVAIWGHAADLGIPVVHTLRDFYLACPKTTMASDAGHPCERQCNSCRMFSVPRASATKHVNAVVGISHFMLKKHRELGMFGASSEHVIYNSYDGVSYAPRCASSLTLGFLGRVVPEKGVQLLLDAFKCSDIEIAGGQLLVAGEGGADYIEALKRSAGSTRVSFIGRQNPPDFFKQIDICVVPSIWNEPLGRVALESLVHGRPVVVTPVGGLPELAQSRAGVVAQGLDVHALRSAMNEMSVRLMGDPDGISLAAEAERGRFLPDVVAKAYLSVYDSVARARLE